MVHAPSKKFPDIQKERYIYHCFITSLCLLSKFHIRFLKNNSFFSKLLFSLLYLTLSVSMTILFPFCIFQLLWNWKILTVKSKNIDGSCIINYKCRYIYHSLLHNTLGFKKIYKRFLKTCVSKYTVIYGF